MNANLQVDSQGRLVHLLTTEGLPAEMIRHILDTAAQFVSGPAVDGKSEALL